MQGANTRGNSPVSLLESSSGSAGGARNLATDNELHRWRLELVSRPRGRRGTVKRPVFTGPRMIFRSPPYGERYECKACGIRHGTASRAPLLLDFLGKPASAVAE